MRSQLSAFLPALPAEVIDDLRRKFDPLIAAQIRPHITLLYQVPDIESVADRCQSWSGGPLHLALTRVSRWPDTDAGIFVAIDDSRGDARRFRAHLLDHVEGDPWRAHVTLMHPLTTDRSARDSAWSTLRSRTVDISFEVDQVTFVSRDGDTWSEDRHINL